MELQEFLALQNIYSGPISGNFYSLTLSAVKIFQSKQGIMPISGYWGPVSQAKAASLLNLAVSDQEEKTETGTSVQTVPVTVTPPPMAPDPVTYSISVSGPMESLDDGPMHLAAKPEQNNQFCVEIYQATGSNQPQPILSPITINGSYGPLPVDSEDIRNNPIQCFEIDNPSPTANAAQLIIIDAKDNVSKNITIYIAKKW